MKQLLLFYDEQNNFIKKKKKEKGEDIFTPFKDFFLTIKLGNQTSMLKKNIGILDDNLNVIFLSLFTIS